MNKSQSNCILISGFIMKNNGNNNITDTVKIAASAFLKTGLDLNKIIVINTQKGADHIAATLSRSAK